MSCVVLAVGGHALRAVDVEGGPMVDRERLGHTADVLAEIALEHALVVTHGNGPQVGMLASLAEEGDRAFREGLDVLGAESEGLIGYLLEREVRSRLRDRAVVALLTQVVVDPLDPAFDRPTKPIGRELDEKEAVRFRATRGWTVTRVEDRWRRVVASPRPLQFLELEAVDLLLSAGHVVICGGGGGIPVIVGPDGGLTGVEAVVDKDPSSSLLAVGIQADLLMLLTDVDGIYRDWPRKSELIERITPSELRALDLGEGSMGPKAEAAAAFVEATGAPAAIGSLDQAMAVLGGSAGTRVVPDARGS